MDICSRRFLAITFFLGSLSCQTAFSQEPTIEETGKYLEAKLESVRGSFMSVRGGLPSKQRLYRISDVHFSDCTLSFAINATTTTRGKNGDTQVSKAVYHVPMKNVISDSVHFTKSSYNGSVITSSIVEFIVNDGLEIEGKAAPDNSHVLIHLDDSNEYKADGLIKALQHARSLCGGKKELF